MLRRHARYAWSQPSYAEQEDVNPLEMVANLSDVMLVLAVALMLLVVTYWQVDMTKPVDIDQDDPEQIEIDESNTISVDALGDLAYVGSVYRDTETGDMYVYAD